MAIRRLDVELATGDTLPRNKRGQPMIWVWRPSKRKRDNGKLVKVQLPYTRMTTFIDALDDKVKLHEYGKRMVLKGATMLDVETLARVEFLDPDDPLDKRALNAIAEQALTVAGAHRKRDRGSLLHKLSEYVDRDEPLPTHVLVGGELLEVTDEDRRDMDAYRCATRDAGLVLTRHIERPVVHDELRIAGTPDRIGWYDGLDPDGQPAGHLIVDLKTGRTDFSALKMAMQLAGYSRSKLYNKDAKTFEESREDMPADLNQRWGVIISLPAGSGVCDVKWVDLTIGWEALLLAKEVRAMRNKGRRVFRSFAEMSSECVTVDEDPDCEGDDGEDDDG